jgi:hypothetical protein
MPEWVKCALFVLCALMIGGALLVGCYRLEVIDCRMKAEDSGHPTKFERGECWVEIAPNLWVRDYDVMYYLDLVESE